MIVNQNTKTVLEDLCLKLVGLDLLCKATCDRNDTAGCDEYALFDEMRMTLLREAKAAGLMQYIEGFNSYSVAGEVYGDILSHLRYLKASN
jgi:hypothetical protein